jgi:hypothetical protein
MIAEISACERSLFGEREGLERTRIRLADWLSLQLVVEMVVGPLA